MKMLLQFLVAIILHPIALLLMLLNLIGRNDLDGGKKIVWALVGILYAFRLGRRDLENSAAA